MARVSYGSRASSSSDYHHSYGMYMRKAAPRGPCKSLEELTRALLEDINAGASSLVPECTTSELSLDCSALLPLHRPNIGPYANGGEHDLPVEFKCQWTNAGADIAAGGLAAKRSHPQATVADIIAPEDTRVRQIIQRAASRGIVAAIEAIDGFKYSFNNAWAAKDEDGQRFSYICQDSMQNKDRHANGFTRTQKHLKGEGERGARKPTFDCKGSISVKCSSNRKCLDVYYRHYAIHPKVCERKSFPRLSLSQSHSKQINGNMMNGNGPQYQYNNLQLGASYGGLQRMDSAYAGPTPSPSLPSFQDEPSGRAPKRKRDSNVFMSHSESGTPLSLSDLLRKSESAGSPPPPSPGASTKTNGVSQSPPVNYDLPSWQQPPLPGPLQRPTQTSPPTLPRTLGPSTPAFTTPYPPPYQPHHISHPQVLPPQQAYASTTPTPPNQERDSPGTSKHPRQRSGGLFSTLKPMPPECPFPGTSTFSTQRPRPSCFNCRHSKRKCDAQRPLCGACQKSGRYDCSYDAGATYAYSPPLQPWIGAPSINMLHVSHQQPIPRRGSPDPWFPTR